MPTACRISRYRLFPFHTAGDDIYFYLRGYAIFKLCKLCKETLQKQEAPLGDTVLQCEVCLAINAMAAKDG